MGPIDNNGKPHVIGALDPIGGGKSWKLWKKQKKEERKKWKESRQKKKLEKLEKLQESHNDEKKESNVLSGDVPGVGSKGRKFTVSIAIPGSILDNAQSPELKTYLAGQIARAAAVFNVDEIIVFDETGITSKIPDVDDFPLIMSKKGHGCIQLIKILQFLECPQYLRRYFFPLHNDLEYAGLLNPLDAPHHLRVDDESPYREGVVLDKPVKDNKGSYVYIGLKKTAVIDKCLQPNIRVTVKFDKEQFSKKHLKGCAVSPTSPSKHDGIYWGYNVRLAKSLGTVFSECPYKEGYDLTIGTSENGSNVDNFVPKEFKHLLIAFGGLKGLEASLEADETLNISEANLLFDHYLNTLPLQGSRTIRTEEAILISLSILRPKLLETQKT